MRMNKTIVTEREHFIFNQFVTNPSLTVKEANELLFNRIGSDGKADNRRMALDRLYTLHNAAKAGSPFPEAATPEERKAVIKARAERSAARKAAKAQDKAVTEATPDDGSTTVAGIVTDDVNLTTNVPIEPSDANVIIPPTSPDIETTVSL